MKKIAIYPGSFDPITFGHIDIIKRAAELFDEIIVAVAQNNQKDALFSAEERVAMIEEEVKNLQNPQIRVEKFSGLLVDFAQQKKSKIIIRGLRAVSDFEYEFQMFGANAKLNPLVQTIFLPASENHHFIASRFVKEIARLRGDISGFVSPNVAEKLRKKLGVNS